MLETRMNESSSEGTINLREIIRILKSRILVILISIAVCVLTASLATFFVLTPKYNSSVQLIVKLPKSDSLNPNVNDVNFTLQMITTYKGIIRSNFVLDEVQKRLAEQDEFQGTTDELRSMIDVTQDQNSQIFSVNVTSADAYQSQAIANTIAEVFRDKLKEVQDIKNVEILSPAKASNRQVSPNNKLNILLGLFVGVLIGIGTAFLMELLDRTVRDENFILDTLYLTNLGTVSRMNEKELSARITKRAAITNKTATNAVIKSQDTNNN